MKYDVITDPEEVVKAKATPKGSRRRVAHTEILLAGGVLWIAGEKHPASRFARAMKRQNMRALQRQAERDGVKGHYIWAEPVEDVAA